MWSCIRQTLDGDRGEQFSLRRNGDAVAYRDVLRFWQHDEEFRTYFISLLATARYPAYRWETPTISNHNVDRPFEFVLLDAPRLDRRPDEHSFAEQFRSAAANQSVVTFSNLGGDAVLVVPCPAGASAAYVHLATFVRQAPAAHVHELWQAVGAAMSSRVGSDPVWLSTAGMGVSWLHVRLDSRPKYYGFAPYRDGK
jgi:hypothetical protein